MTSDKLDTIGGDTSKNAFPPRVTIYKFEQDGKLVCFTEEHPKELNYPNPEEYISVAEANAIADEGAKKESAEVFEEIISLLHKSGKHREAELILDFKAHYYEALREKLK